MSVRDKLFLIRLQHKFPWLVEYSIPKDSQQRDIWLDLLDLPETTNGRVCSKHFEAKDFEIKCDGSVWLKRNACPMQCDEPDEIEYIEMVDTVSTNINLEVSLN